VIVVVAPEVDVQSDCLQRETCHTKHGKWNKIVPKKSTQRSFSVKNKESYTGHISVRVLFPNEGGTVVACDGMKTNQRMKNATLLRGANQSYHCNVI
jgi:hypothetical protein